MKRIVRVGIILLLAFSSGLGCQAIKKLSTKPPEGLVHQNYAVRFSGYKQTVMVKATPEELVAFLGDFRNWFNIPGAEIPTLEQGSQGQLSVGASFPLKVKKMGIEISGRMIIAKSSDEELWVIFDNPRMMQVQRWRFEPAKAGTLLTINMATESPETALTQVLETGGVVDQICKEIDYMIARIQAHFDPSLNPDELVAGGLRGELYESFWQAEEISAWINAPSEKAIQVGLELDNVREILSAGEVEGLGECLFEPENRRKWEKGEEGEPIFCPIILKLAGLEIPTNSFTIIKPNDLQNFFTMYGVIMDTVFARLKLVGQPEKGGTRVQLILAMEPIGPAPELTDALVRFSALPQWMEKIILGIKAKVEGKV